jgi:hypothetical protein
MVTFFILSSSHSFDAIIVSHENRVNVKYFLA